MSIKNTNISRIKPADQLGYGSFTAAYVLWGRHHAAEAYLFFCVLCVIR